MTLSHLSPTFRAVMEIATHAGSGMTVQQFCSIRFPAGVCQVWRFKPALPPLERAAVVVGVFIRGRGISRWTPLNLTFENAVAHYQRLADQQRTPAAPTEAPTEAPAGSAFAANRVPAMPPLRGSTMALAGGAP